MISSNNISITHLHKFFGYCSKNIKESKFSAYYADLETHLIKKDRVKHLLDNVYSIIVIHYGYFEKVSMSHTLKGTSEIGGVFS